MNDFKSILIATYTNPDLDGFSSAFAYHELLCAQGTESVVGIYGNPRDEVQYLLARYNLTFSHQTQDPSQFTSVILVDASEIIGIDPRIRPESVIEVIDHRKINEANLFPNAKIQIELVGAAATLVAEKLYSNGLKPSRDIALLLYGAIISNTLNFQSKVTTDRDRKMSERLIEIVKPDVNFIHDMFIAKSELTGNALKKKIASESAGFTVGKTSVSIIQLEIVGGNNLIQTRSVELIEGLDRVNERFGSTLRFYTIPDLEEGYNYFFTDNEETKQLLSAVLGVTFTGFTARREGLILRKEIWPLIKAWLESATE